MDNNTGSMFGLGGMGAGAGIGFLAGGPIGAALGAGIGGMGGGLLGSIFGGGDVERPDISRELAKISELYAQARAAARTSITQESNAGRSQAVSNMAARGTYRSPVANNIFNAIEAARLQAIGRSEGQLAGQEAGTMSQALSALMGYDVQAQQANAQKQAGIASGFTSLGSSLLMAYLMRQPGTAGSIGSAPTGSSTNMFGATQPLPSVINPYRMTAPMF